MERASKDLLKQVRKELEKPPVETPIAVPESITQPEILKLTPETADTKSKAIQEILQTLQPLIEVKTQNSLQLAAMRKAVTDFTLVLTRVNEQFQLLSGKLDQIEAAKSQNADLEKQVLTKLMNIL